MRLALVILIAVMLSACGMRQSATPTATPPLPSAGTQTRIKSAQPGRSSYIWVNRTAIDAFQRAYDERDERGMDTVVRVFESIQVADGTLVEIVRVDGRVIQIEVLEGSTKGRRGWVLPIQIGLL